MKSMTSLATGPSAVLDKDIKSLHPPIFNKSTSPPPWPPKQSLPVAETELCFFQTTLQGGLPSPCIYSLAIILVQLAFSMLLGSYSLDSFKSNFINTFSQQM